MAKKPRAAVRAVGQTPAFIRPVGRGGKLGKPQPVVIIPVRVGAAAPAKKTKRRGRRGK